MSGGIGLSSGTLTLDGTPSVVLCSSVFPFRIPRSQWDHRLELVQESGYGMIDLYVHWGFHEEVPGRIDLTSPERELQHFLDLAAARGLLVMARPGPYICSETDGGGLPWWLHHGASGAPQAVRTSDPVYLEAVDRWFGAVIPLLAANQTTSGGPVALLQIENELDFFDCPDPGPYMEHLARSCREHGIEVPIIACAGQGELRGASGDAEGVIPTVNLYPSDTSRTFDEEARYYTDVLAARNLPLMVTETNRMHRTLRREILAGARLVAPYLQTSGFDHLVLPSAGNWGDPGNLMTHDYDFGGYISPDGRRRPEYDEAIALARTLAAWGERLATATPVGLGQAPIEGAQAGGALALDGGGFLLGPADLDGTGTVVRLHPASRTGTDGPVDAALAPGSCPFWAVDVPLAPWGREGTLTVATAELVGVDDAGAELVLVFEGDETALVELVVQGADARPHVLRLSGLGELAATPETGVGIVVRERPASRADRDPVLRRLDTGMRSAGELRWSEVGTVAGPGSVPASSTEAHGLHDGRLRAEFEISPSAVELVVLGAADLVRLELDGNDHGLHVAHGAPLSLPVPGGASHRLRVTTETWGRANFDDPRLPALRLGAGRGAGAVLQIRSARDITDLWEVHGLPDRRGLPEGATPPLRALGGWSSTRTGETALYVRDLDPSGDPSAEREHGEPVAVRFHGLRQPLRLSVDGGASRLVTPSDPVVLLAPGERPARLMATAPHVPGGLLEGVELLRGDVVPAHEVRLLTAAELAGQISAAANDAAAQSWHPVAAAEAEERGSHVAPGAAQLHRLDLPLDGAAGSGLLLELEGEDVQITVVSGARRVSRHVLGAPVTAGGHPARSWIPAGWAGGRTEEVLLFVEAIDARGGKFKGARAARTER
ncbi:MAG: beta-galactosidase [Actinomycetales bacterium]|nr:beta-galactosidase [Actinomycetales bacterium]